MAFAERRDRDTDLSLGTVARVGPPVHADDARPFMSKVLHIFSRMARGGAELRTLEVLRHIHADAHQFDFLCLASAEGPLNQDLAEIGGRAYEIRLDRRFPDRFVRLLRRAKYDAVHSHVHLASGAILMLAKVAGTRRRIAHFRSTGDGAGNGGRRRVYRGLMRNAIRGSATHIAAVSEASMEHGFGVAGWRDDPRSRIVYNGLALENYRVPADVRAVRCRLGIPLEARLLVHVGRFDPAKNHKRGVDILDGYMQRRPDVHALFVGDPTRLCGPDVRMRTNRASTAARFHFAGELAPRHVAEVLQASDAFFFPSKREGLPGALLEACAAGLPSVTSDHPSMFEIARYFDAVVPVALAGADEAFHEALDAALAAPREDVAAIAASVDERFGSTPFTIRAAARAFRELYGIA